MHARNSMACAPMLPRRRSVSSRALKAFPTAPRRLCRWGFCDECPAVVRRSQRAWGIQGTFSGTAIYAPPAFA
eukprot:349893-Chlamydomonas_euryale.AAC.4